MKVLNLKKQTSRLLIRFLMLYFHKYMSNMRNYKDLIIKYDLNFKFKVPDFKGFLVSI